MSVRRGAMDVAWEPTRQQLEEKKGLGSTDLEDRHTWITTRVANGVKVFVRQSIKI